MVVPTVGNFETICGRLEAGRDVGATGVRLLGLEFSCVIMAVGPATQLRKAAQVRIYAQLLQYQNDYISLATRFATPLDFIYLANARPILQAKKSPVNRAFYIFAYLGTLLAGSLGFGNLCHFRTIHQFHQGHWRVITIAETKLENAQITTFTLFVARA